MKIYNVKLKPILFIIIGMIVVLLSLILIRNLICSSPIIMNDENYTYILKDCHENPYDYVNKNIKCIGYVYRSNDFNNTQFVIARDMLVSDTESRIVGFLCEYSNADKLENNEWIELCGNISIGNYHGAMPIIKVKKVERITTPLNTFVLPPT